MKIDVRVIDLRDGSRQTLIVESWETVATVKSLVRRNFQLSSQRAWAHSSTETSHSMVTGKHTFFVRRKRGAGASFSVKHRAPAVLRRFL